jgi:hypothetical protein
MALEESTKDLSLGHFATRDGVHFVLVTHTLELYYRWYVEWFTNTDGDHVSFNDLSEYVKWIDDPMLSLILLNVWVRMEKHV